MARGRRGRVLAVFLSGLLGVILGGGLAGWLAVRQQESREMAQPFVVAPEGEEKGGAITEAVKRAGPAVVQITTKLAPGGRPGILPELFSLPEDLFPEGQGSGVIINAKNGYVITNAHVLRAAQNIQVKLADERQFTAREIAKDHYSDLAVVQIKADRLPSVTIGSAKGLPIGSWVVAIGNPFGLFENTVTVGVLSAKDRSITPPDRQTPLEDLLQTDAAINRGNSGGALVNLKGELVGVPTAIITPAQGQGLGFAISVDGLDGIKSIIPELIAHGKVSRAWLGVMYREVTPDDVKELKLPSSEGVLLAEVTSNGPAKRAGLRKHDVILAIDEKPLRQKKHLKTYIRARKPDDAVSVQIWREGRRMKMQVRLGEMPADLSRR